MGFDFHFELDDTVITPLAGYGVVHMLGRDHGGKCVQIINQDGTKTWWPEHLLKKGELQNDN